MADKKHNEDLVVLRPEGLYCPAGDFHIDPWKPVRRAVITHGHGDHARRGMGCYFTTRASLPILHWRLGADQNYNVNEYGEPFTLGDARVSLHPAGHVLGSAQVRIEVGERVWVASGDYKRQPDPTCAPFEVIACDTFITEATFGLPIYRWPETRAVVQEISAWRKDCAAKDQAAVLYCYALGKAQRVLAELLSVDNEPVWLHGAVDTGVAVYRGAGIDMVETHPVAEAEKHFDFAGKLIIAPPSAAGSPWLRRFKRAQHGFASGWMRVRGNRRRGNYDRGFVLSDHADWPDLLRTVKETGAREVIATHGNTDALVSVLNASGIHTRIFDTDFGGDD